MMRRLFALALVSTFDLVGANRQHRERATCAIADGTDEGLAEGFDWCVERMEDGDTLTLFVAQKSALSNSRLPNEWVSQYRDVEVATARGLVLVNRGPVLAHRS